MTAVSRPPTARRNAQESSRSISNGMDVVGVVLVFFFAGFGLDKWLGTAPWFTLALTIVGIVGTFLRAYYAYATEMDRLAAERQKSRTVGAPAAADRIANTAGGESA